MAAKTTQKAQDGTTIPAAQEKAEKTAENETQNIIATLNFKERVVALQNELHAPKSRYNTFANYAYRSCEDILEAVKPLCQKYGLLLHLSDTIEQIGERFYIKAIATLQDVRSEESITAVGWAREGEPKKGLESSQQTGLTSSYCRKYCLNALLLCDDAKDADTDEYHAQTTGEQPKAKAQAAPLSGIDKEAYYREISELPNAEAVQAWWKCHKPEFPAGVDTEMYTACKRQLEHLNQIKNNQ